MCEEPVVANAEPILRTVSQMCIRVKLDENPNWDSHIEMICKKASAAILFIFYFLLFFFFLLT
jgi:hypothetical protein